MSTIRNKGTDREEAMRAALMQASLDLMNLSAFLRLEGKTEIADIGLQMSEAARSAAAEPELFTSADMGAVFARDWQRAVEPEANDDVCYCRKVPCQCGEPEEKDEPRFTQADMDAACEMVRAAMVVKIKPRNATQADCDHGPYRCHVGDGCECECSMCIQPGEDPRPVGP